MTGTRASERLRRAPSARELARGGLALLGIFASVPAIALVAGCGGDDALPHDAVAEVGDSVITKSDFERALRFATGAANDPRDYGACVAAKQRRASEASGSQTAEAELEKRCREEYEKIKSNVMDGLITAEGTRQEADARGIVVSDAQVQRVLDQAKQSLFDTEALRRSGVGEKELFALMRLNQLHGKVIAQLAEQARKVSTKDIADYYRRNKKSFVVPHRRDARLVITRTRARAEAAKAALGSGRSWESVAKDYSLHFSRNDGGRIKAEWKRPDKAGLGAALFRARRGELVGPVKSDERWAVFVADRMQRSHLPTLAQVRDDITKRLRSRREKQARAAFTEKYRDKTTCAPGYKVPACKNGPKEIEDDPGS